MTRCNCGTVWQGLKIAHCTSAGCHATFTTVRNFDKHWRGRGDDRHCVHPATVGLVPHQRPGYVVWGEPLREAAAAPRTIRGTRDTDQAPEVVSAAAPGAAIRDGGGT